MSEPAAIVLRLALPIDGRDIRSLRLLLKRLLRSYGLRCVGIAVEPVTSPDMRQSADMLG